MTKSANGVPSDLKNRIYDDLADIMIVALRDGKMTVEESEQSAAFILDNIQDIESFPLLMAFLKDLGLRWYEFDIVYHEMLKQELMLKVKEELRALNGAVTN